MLRSAGTLSVTDSATRPTRSVADAVPVAVTSEILASHVVRKNSWLL